MSSTEYQVQGMTCAHCESAVRGEVQKLPGVTAVSVSASDGRLVVESSVPLSRADVVGAVDDAGYAAEAV